MDKLDFSPEKIKEQKKNYYASFLWKLTVALIIIMLLQFIIINPVIIISRLLLETIANPSNAVSNNLDYSTVNNILSTVSSVLQLIGLMFTDGIGAWFLYSMTKETSRAPQKRNMPFGYWIVAFLICFGLGGIFMLVGNIAESIVLLPGTTLRNMLYYPLASSSGSIAENIIYANDSWLYFLTQVLIAGFGIPVLEEFIFRKLVIDNTSKYGFGAAVMISAFSFGAFHFNLRQFFYAFALGMVFAYVYAFTGNIRYSIAFHIGYNMYSSFVIALAKKLATQEALESLSESAKLLGENLKSDPGMAMNAFYGFYEYIQSLAEKPVSLFGISFYVFARLFAFLLMFTGIVLFLVFLRKAIKVRSQMPMGEKGTKRCAAFNYGAAMFYVLVGIVFFAYYFMANISAFWGHRH